MSAFSNTIIVALLVVAGLADCLASDVPIIMRTGHKTVFFEGKQVGGLELRGLALAEYLGEEDWAFWPPLRHHPESSRYEGELNVLDEPSTKHLLGTDDRGRDVASRLIHGTRFSVTLALLSALFSTALALFLAFCALQRSWLAAVVLTLCDLIAAVPPLLMVLVIGTLFHTQSFFALLFLITLPPAASTTRIVHDSFCSSISKVFCTAAKAIGCSQFRVVWRHALPQTFSQLRVAAVMTASLSVLSEVALRFLGISGAIGDSSWGELLKQAHENEYQWWLLLPTGLLIFLLSFSLGRLAQDFGKSSTSLFLRNLEP